MRIDPYLSVDGMPFTISEAALRLQFGAPLEVSRSMVGLNELDYGEAVYRFQDNGRLEEVTKRAHVLHIATVAVPFDTLAAFIAATDPGRFERAGFIVSPRCGIAFVPAQGPWVTALARHCIDSWRSL
ncbi:hypothetical protein [Piscinibacter sakaiensis]|uniref:hypothetical protein n=1 Tax=Piscinibacter sakaiensis TaxID=1547922 RepID=UPI003AAD7E68